MTFLLLYWKQAVGAALLLFVLGFAYHLGGANGRAKLAECRAQAEKTIAEMARAEADLQAKYRKAEQDKAAQVALIAEQYEQDKADAQAAADRTIADLRSGTIRLRDRWQASRATCDVSGAAARAAVADAAAADREQGASDLVRAARDADAQIRGLQAVVREDRK